MLRVCTGPFHPTLESALVEDVRRLKTGEPLAPLAIIVPSQLLIDRLRRLLVLDARLPLLNVHFLTFHQLVLKLTSERAFDDSETRPPASVDDFCFEQLARHIVLERPLSGMEPLEQLGTAAGTWAALWATLRDMKDGAVDPAAAIQAVREGQFDSEDCPWLEALFTLYAGVLEGSRVLGIGSADDLAADVLPWIPHSPFLAHLRQAIYYGFYDLSQVQLSLLERIAQRTETTVYFPLVQTSEFKFALRFYERRLLPLAASTAFSPVTDLPNAGGTGQGTVNRQDSLDVEITHTVGPEEELAAVCREILALVETHGYRFDEIGVVARTLEPYAPLLSRLFEQHRIPFTSTAVRLLFAEPVTKTLWQLASLRNSGFYATTLLDLLSSPYYRTDGSGLTAFEWRPDLWRLAIQELGITKGEQEWRRLVEAGQETNESNANPLSGGEEDERDQDSDEEDRAPVKVGRREYDHLWRLVSRLIEDCRSLPDRGTVAELTNRFLELAVRHLSIPGLTEDGELSDGKTLKDQHATSVAAALQEAFDRLRQLDRLGLERTWEEWTVLLQQVFERGVIPIGEADHEGVQVLDAMSARGLPFKALCLIGLNEKVFPRMIREDAFLRDRSRRVLDATLGYKIDEKLAGYDEERLLFSLLCQAATSRLLLFYQRADVEGRLLASSTFLEEARRRYGLSAEQDEAVPRQLTELVNRRPSVIRLLPIQTVILHRILRQQDPGDLLQAMERPVELFQQGYASLRPLEFGSSQVGDYDGLTGPLADHWKRALEAGFSPSALESYARCPFQYFGRQVLRLKSVRPDREEGPAPRLIGTLCHDALRLCYERLTAAGWPDALGDGSALAGIIRTAVHEVFDAHEASMATGYQLLWNLAWDLVRDLVQEAILSDREDCLQTGYRPVAFELEVEGRLTACETPETPVIKIRGRLDRVDQRQQDASLRIVDYKYKQGFNQKKEDRDLATAALRGARLQPPLYARMSIPVQSQTGASDDSLSYPDLVEFLFLAPHWTPRIDRSSFPAALWTSAAGSLLQRTIQTWLRGIREGQFVILPDSYCEHCELASACRLQHGPTWSRAFHSIQGRTMRALRKQKVPE
ncbi:hypothetical protein DNFV4_02411 [Nitrospira tepida]|uniref:PD-(D/E)XK endonuclease-like domain-containing protein n=1 Tax=Nitrospira tepida TaxID=2973512 RepID=A0AA86MZK1_9BACT|nr:PD-(D/E)XK nuclease family protein [Nitrospira tepida]CAI4031988.1 hypothetical protein DNFV4_02411 [Nitrospira tepida]